MARKITDAIIQEMKRLYEKNGCYSMTAKLLGVSPATVSKYLKKTAEKKETTDVYNGPQPQLPEKEKILAFDGERKITSLEGEDNVFLLRRV